MSEAPKLPCQWPVSSPCKIAFVSEAPIDEELIRKVPLTGPAGRVFNAAMRAANLDRDEYLITTVFDELPPEDGCAEWMKDPVRVEESKARLNEQIAKCKPNVIVPLGGTALWAFTEQTGIKNYRGAVCKSVTDVAPGMKLLPTFHPSYVMKNWSALPIVTGDFVRAAEEGEYPEFRYPQTELLIEPSIEEIREFAKECIAAPKLSLDIETGWGQITSIGFAVSTSRALNVPFLDLRKNNKSYWPLLDQELAVWLIVKEICEAPNPKVGQNFMYDIFWLYEQKGIAVRNYRSDTRLRHKVLYPELQADLGNMAASYTKIGAWKSWRGGLQKDVKKDG